VFNPFFSRHRCTQRCDDPSPVHVQFVYSAAADKNVIGSNRRCRRCLHHPRLITAIFIFAGGPAYVYIISYFFFFFANDDFFIIILFFYSFPRKTRNASYKQVRPLAHSLAGLLLLQRRFKVNSFPPTPPPHLCSTSNRAAAVSATSSPLARVIDL
jgi:hypothetical protein